MSAYAGTPQLTRPLQPYPLVTDTPTGDVEPPFILVEGAEKSGKSWEVAKFTGDPRILYTWWIEWGEKPCAKEYGAIPGARYEVVRHDGSFWSVLSLVEQITELARAMITTEAAPMIVIDTMSGEWRSLKDLAHRRTMASPSVLRKIERNPAAVADAHTIHSNTWNDVIDLHYELVRLLQGFPGVAVMISRGKEVTAFDDAGRPVPGEKTYRVEGQKDLAFDASAWVRMSRDGNHSVVAARSARAPRRPNATQPGEYRGLGWLVFDKLQYQPRPWTPPPAAPVQPTGPARPPAASPQEPRTVGGRQMVVHDWAAELERVNGTENLRERYDRLTELWSAASLANAGQPIRDEIAAAGRVAAAELGIPPKEPGAAAPADTPDPTPDTTEATAPATAPAAAATTEPPSEVSS